MAEPYGVSVPPMFDRADAAATYERLAGGALDDLAWYEALAGYRFGIILMRMGLRSIAYGQLPMPDDIDVLMMFPRLLRQLLGEI
jgi:aminoglycoside phosphotransferase (APT) family kinase protein